MTSADRAIEIAAAQSTLTYWVYAPESRTAELDDVLADRGFVLERCALSQSPEYTGEHVVIVAGTSGWMARHSELAHLGWKCGATYDGWETGVLPATIMPEREDDP